MDMIVHPAICHAVHHQDGGGVHPGLAQPHQVPGICCSIVDMCVLNILCKTSKEVQSMVVPYSRRSNTIPKVYKVWRCSLPHMQFSSNHPHTTLFPHLQADLSTSVEPCTAPYHI